MLFVVGVSIFYTFKMMNADDQLQKSRKLAAVNARSLRFKFKHTTLRIFYLFFFSSSLLFHHDVGGLGMLAIVYARCLMVRERKTLEGATGSFFHQLSASSQKLFLATKRSTPGSVCKVEKARCLSSFLCV